MAMSTSHTHDVSRHVKVYILVFLALLVGTVVTVAMNSVHFENPAVTIGVALFIAALKAFLVAGFFMHLISERKAIYAILLATLFFFSGMMYLTIWSRGQVPVGTVYSGKSSVHPAATTLP
jgi:cytochrome c oxidase subunit IV